MAPAGPWKGAEVHAVELAPQVPPAVPGGPLGDAHQQSDGNLGLLCLDEGEDQLRLWLAKKAAAF